jgi:hypothetical protein
MKDKLNEILKKISFVTNAPEVDWPRMFTILVLIGCFSVAWNVYFYYIVQAGIAASESASKDRAAATMTREDEIKDVIKMYEDKKIKQTKLLESPIYKLEDPSVL